MPQRAIFDRLLLTYYYTSMVRAVIRHRLRIEDLITRAGNYPTFSSAVMPTAMGSVASRTILEASNDTSPLL